MFGLEVFDASVLQDLNARTWFEVDVFAAMLSESTASITGGGHLVLWSPRLDPALRLRALDVFWSLEGAAQEEELLVPEDFHIHVFYGDTLYRGRHSYYRHVPSWDVMGYYRQNREPDVFGDVEDQEPGYTTITVALKKGRLAALRDKWNAYSRAAGFHGKSSLRLAASGSALQLRLSCDEVSIEDVIEVSVAGALAIKHQRQAVMVLGLSFVRVNASPTLTETRTRILVEDEYGPFENV